MAVPGRHAHRLRRSLSRATPTAAGSPDEIHGTSFHTLRRTVGTLIAHEVSLDAAREQLGHRDPSVTYQHYVGRRAVAPDVREVLDRLLADVPPGDVGTRACLEPFRRRARRQAGGRDSSLENPFRPSRVPLTTPRRASAADSTEGRFKPHSSPPCKVRPRKRVTNVSLGGSRGKKTPPGSRVPGGVGAACQNRTDDLVITSDSLYRLS